MSLNGGDAACTVGISGRAYSEITTPTGGETPGLSSPMSSAQTQNLQALCYVIGKAVADEYNLGGGSGGVSTYTLTTNDHNNHYIDILPAASFTGTTLVEVWVKADGATAGTDYIFARITACVKIISGTPTVVFSTNPFAAQTGGALANAAAAIVAQGSDIQIRVNGDTTLATTPTAKWTVGVLIGAH